MSVAESPVLKLPPQAVDVEEALLGAILIDPAAFTNVADVVDESCFYKESHRIIYKTMMYLYANSVTIDSLTLTEELRRIGMIDRVGGAFFVTGLSNKIPSSSNISEYAKIVEAKARKRKLITVATAMIDVAYQDRDDVDEIIDRIESQIFAIAQSKATDGFAAIKSSLFGAIEQIDSYMQKPNGVHGVGSGFIAMDKILGGFQKNNLIILAARPGMGKTALALNIARNAALKQKKGVGIVSLEMGSTELAMRLICAEAKIDMQRVRFGRISKDEYQKLMVAGDALSSAPIWIDETPGLSVIDIRARARRLKSEHDIEILIIDYLQLATAAVRYNSNRQEEIAVISRSLKALAKELQIPVLTLSQLSRDVEKRGGDKRPQLSDLRDSGAIEQDADVVMFIHREDYYDKEKFINNQIMPADVIIAKHRNGPTGDARLGWLPSLTKFVDFTQER